MTVSGCTFTGNQAIGGAGNAGGILTSDGAGGGIMTVYYGSTAVPVTATVSGSTFASNQAIGGSGADGLGGALANILGATLTVSGCTLTGNQAVGGALGPGANGGNGLGGGIDNDGPSTLRVLGTAITGNQAVGGAAGSGGTAGLGAGGGTYLAIGALVEIDAPTTISGNAASSGDDDVFGIFTTL